MPKLFIVFTSVMVLTVKGLGQTDGETFNLELNGNHDQLKGYNVREMSIPCTCWAFLKLQKELPVKLTCHLNSKPTYKITSTRIVSRW